SVFNQIAPAAVYPLSLHDALPILDDFGLADVASRVEAPRDERESLLGDRLGLLQVPGDSYDCEGSRRGRVQMPALPLYARKEELDRKSTRLNSSHDQISYAVFCLK